jgi:hypothetical protein
MGAEMDRIQDRLLAMRPVIDNPLRIPSTNNLVRAGVIRVRKVRDLSAVRTVSIAEQSPTYLGHCSGCSELCGAGLLDKADVRPDSPQGELFGD